MMNRRIHYRTDCKKRIGWCVFAALAVVLFAASAPAHEVVPEQPALEWRVLPVDDFDQPQYGDWYAFVKLAEQRARLRGGGVVRDVYPQGDYYPYVNIMGRGLDITVPRAFARPGDRWVEVFVGLDAAVLEEDSQVRLHAALFEPGGVTPLAEREIVPEARAGLLKVDMRRFALSAARLQVTLSADGEQLAAADLSLSSEPTERPLAEGERIAVGIDTPEGIERDEAVALTFGVPFPAGSLWDSRGVRLVNDAGDEVASQSETTGRWSPDGAVKWMRFDAVAVPDEGLNVEIRPATAGSAPARPLRVETTDAGVTVDTGVARYELGKGASPILAIIGQDGREVATSAGARGLYVIDQQGRLGVSSADGQTMEVESSGPTAACVRFEGYYRTDDGEPLARHITRVELFAGLPQAKVTHTLVLSRDTNEVWFQDIGWELSVAPGADAAGVFGTSHVDVDRHVEVVLDADTASAYVLQEEHLRFGEGDNRFYVAVLDGEGGRETVYEGERMGDWAALYGAEGGLAAAVRDAALQHPKEFELDDGRLNIRLFSPRIGEELDFRAETMVERWNIPEMVTDRGQTFPAREKIAAIESNAIGWSKTHDIMVSPLPADAAAEQSIRMARLNAGRVYGHVDPWWIYETQAMGPLHPKDVENYPGAEENIEMLIEGSHRHLRGTNLYGFVDYNAGPSFEGRNTTQGGRGIVIGRRFGSTYQLRPDLWGLYARSGERFVRTFAEDTNRAWADNYFVHWGGPRKTRGLSVEGRSARPAIGTNDLPFYWEEETRFHMGDATSMEHITYDYWLTGNRRARDVTEAYVEGVKEAWTPAAAANDHYNTRAFVHAYDLTHDPALRALTEATASYLYDPEGATGMTKNKDRGATYKARIAVRGLIDGWRTFGTPAYYDMARRVSEYKWHDYFPLGGVTSPFAIAGNFLYRETGSPYYAERLLFFLQSAPQFRLSHDPSSATTAPFRTADLTTGVPLAQDAVARYGEEQRAQAAWAAYQDEDASRPLRVAVSKGAYDHLDIYFTTQTPVKTDFHRARSTTRKADTTEWIRPLTPAAHQDWRSRDRDMVSIEHLRDQGMRVGMRMQIPKEAPGEAYAVNPLHHGVQHVTGVITRPEVLQLEPRGRRWTQDYEWEGRIAMVLCAPLGWRTASMLKNPYGLPTTPRDARVYFKQPEGVRDARVYFSEPTELFTPGGEPFAVGDEEEVSGWVSLPSDDSGLWSFTVGLGWGKDVEVRNLPPFFAFGDQVHYFEPPIPWVEWLSPKADAEVAGELEIAFNVHLPDDVNAERIRVYVDEEEVYSGKDAPRDLVLDVSGRDAGEYALRVVAETREYSETYETRFTVNAGE